MTLDLMWSLKIMTVDLYFEIYLVRHGLAGQFGDYADDSQRPLTEDGQKKTRKVAQRLQELGLSFDRIYTSPYERADQTAQILQSSGLGTSIERWDTLQPDGDRTRLIDQLNGDREAGRRVAIVGHEPDLSQLAETLVFGIVQGGLVLKKAGIIGLMAPIEGELVGNCQLFWLVPPRLLMDSTHK